MGALCSSTSRRAREDEDEEFNYPWTLVRDVSEKDKAITRRMHKKWKKIENDLRDAEYWFWWWSWWDSLVRSCYRIIVAVCLIASTIVSTVAGASMTPTLSYVAAGLTAVGALKDPLEKLFIDEFTTKKRRMYKDICRIRRVYLDRMFIEYLRASADQDITTEELENYVKLAYEMDNDLMHSGMEHEGLFGRGVFDLPSKDTHVTTGTDLSSIVKSHAKTSIQKDDHELHDVEQQKKETRIDILATNSSSSSSSDN